MMAVRKKPGYNWKARQYSVNKISASINSPKIEPDQVYLSGTNGSNSDDLILPNRKRLDSSIEEYTPKRKKLSSKQRKRLQKIIESKEKKAKVSIPINAHPTWLHGPYKKLAHVPVFSLRGRLYSVV